MPIFNYLDTVFFYTYTEKDASLKNSTNPSLKMTGGKLLHLQEAKKEIQAAHYDGTESAILDFMRGTKINGKKITDKNILQKIIAENLLLKNFCKKYSQHYLYTGQFQSVNSAGQPVFFPLYKDYEANVVFNQKELYLVIMHGPFIVGLSNNELTSIPGVIRIIFALEHSSKNNYNIAFREISFTNTFLKKLILNFNEEVKKNITPGISAALIKEEATQKNNQLSIWLKFSLIHYLNNFNTLQKFAEKYEGFLIKNLNDHFDKKNIEEIVYDHSFLILLKKSVYEKNDRILNFLSQLPYLQNRLSSEFTFIFKANVNNIFNPTLTHLPEFLDILIQYSNIIRASENDRDIIHAFFYHDSLLKDFVNALEKNRSLIHYETILKNKLGGFFNDHPELLAELERPFLEKLLLLFGSSSPTFLAHCPELAYTWYKDQCFILLVESNSPAAEKKLWVKNFSIFLYNHPIFFVRLAGKDENNFLQAVQKIFDLKQCSLYAFLLQNKILRKSFMSYLTSYNLAPLLTFLNSYITITTTLSVTDNISALALNAFSDLYNAIKDLHPLPKTSTNIEQLNSDGNIRWTDCHSFLEERISRVEELLNAKLEEFVLHVQKSRPLSPNHLPTSPIAPKIPLMNNRSHLSPTFKRSPVSLKNFSPLRNAASRSSRTTTPSSHHLTNFFAMPPKNQQSDSRSSDTNPSPSLYSVPLQKEKSQPSTTTPLASLTIPTDPTFSMPQ